MSKEKSTMFVYSDGRIQIPKILRTRIKINPGDLVSMRVEKGDLIISPIKHKCVICESEKGLNCVDGQYICIDCVEKVVDAWQKWRF